MSKRILLLLANLLWIGFIAAQDSIMVRRNHLLHRFSVEARPEYIFPTNNFLRGDNRKGQALNFAMSGHATYSFQFPENSLMGRVYGNCYQGVGLGYYSFFDKEEMGNPLAFYLFQGSTLARFGDRASLDFEWNFGISSGWKTYNHETNPFNGGVGSRMNAYLNLDLNIKWNLTHRLDMITGVTVSHFSNGNTKYPNAGINTGGARIGFAYYLNRPDTRELTFENYQPLPEFKKYISYDLMFFGAWRRRGVFIDGKEIAPKSAYPVCGFTFAPMYNICNRFRAGLSLDGFYDGSGNVYTESYAIAWGDEDPGYTFYDPKLKEQLSLGLSVRAEYVMPFFSINLGIGNNFLYAKGDMKGFYQMLTLKIAVTRFAYLNVGYSLHDFQTPNSLMLGIGLRLNNKSPMLK